MPPREACNSINILLYNNNRLPWRLQAAMASVIEMLAFQVGLLPKLWAALQQLPPCNVAGGSLDVTSNVQIAVLHSLEAAIVQASVEAGFNCR